MNNPIRTLSLSALIALSAIAMTGCDTASQGGKTYTRGQAQQQMKVHYGVLLNVAAVTIEPEKTGGGAAVGAATGGVLFPIGLSVSTHRGRQSRCPPLQIARQAAATESAIAESSVARWQCDEAASRPLFLNTEGMTQTRPGAGIIHVPIAKHPTTDSIARPPTTVRRRSTVNGFEQYPLAGRIRNSGATVVVR